MGLKQSIVVVSEYTIKNHSGKGGSRGGTPGDYLLRYMARHGATEDLTPVRFEEVDNYLLRYAARKEATDEAISVEGVKQNIRKVDGYGGVAFGYGDVSLSHEKLKAVSRHIQEQFDSGKTVMKTVISFDSDYLRKNGLLREDFEFEKRGDFRGNIDQMKLRKAIMLGMERMSREYDDLQYAGVIQVDTEHVHCHLVMLDEGRGHIMYDGTQRGKINRKAIRQLRRGIDTYLDENQTVAHMSSNITNDKRNALCFIKKFTHKTMDMHGTAQFLLACLPEDKTMWRAATNRKEMKKANAIVREYVEQVLAEPDSGYRKAIRDIDAYANERRVREDLSFSEYEKLVRDGRERIVEDCMNGVYAVLKQIPNSEKPVRTPMIDAMSLDYETAAAKAENDDFMEFGFKLRSYSSRLDHHRKEMHKYHNLKEDYDKVENASESSHVMRDFYENEEQYNAMLMCKYQYFLSFLPPNDEYEDEWNDLMNYRKRMRNVEKMLNDPSLKRMKPESAEDYGVKVYAQHGGAYVATTPVIIERRLAQMQETYKRKSEAFSFKLSDWGMTMDENGVSMKKPYAFDDVKALDLHHLSYDFHRDISVSYINVQNFIQAAKKRSELYESAKYYLEQTGQEGLLSMLPGRDIELMKEAADKMGTIPVVEAAKPVATKQHGSRTVRLDRDYVADMKFAIRAIVAEDSMTGVTESGMDSSISYTSDRTVE